VEIKGEEKVQTNNIYLTEFHFCWKTNISFKIPIHSQWQTKGNVFTFHYCFIPWSMEIERKVFKGFQKRKMISCLTDKKTH
jgi:hypothetical protein